MNNINIKSQAMAEAWRKDVDELNHNTQRLLEQVGKALQAVKDDADSTIVDEIYTYGNQIMEGAQNVYQGMTQLFNMVGDILNMLTGVLESGMGIVKGIVGAIGGF